MLRPSKTAHQATTHRPAVRRHDQALVAAHRDRGDRVYVALQQPLHASVVVVDHPRVRGRVEHVAAIERMHAVGHVLVQPERPRERQRRRGRGGGGRGHDRGVRALLC